MYKLFYNRKKDGDILNIVFNKPHLANRTYQKDDVSATFFDDDILSIKIANFSKIVKLHVEGELVDVPSSLLEVGIRNKRKRSR